MLRVEVWSNNGLGFLSFVEELGKLGESEDFCDNLLRGNFLFRYSYSESCSQKDVDGIRISYLYRVLRHYCYWKNQSEVYDVMRECYMVLLSSRRIRDLVKEYSGLIMF